ncbi:unnamed protein product, partial [Iphiclides podalirius]
MRRGASEGRALRRRAIDICMRYLSAQLDAAARLFALMVHYRAIAFARLRSSDRLGIGTTRRFGAINATPRLLRSGRRAKSLMVMLGRRLLSID